MMIAIIGAYFWAWPVLAEAIPPVPMPPSDMVSLGALGIFMKIVLGAGGGIMIGVLSKAWGAKAERQKREVELTGSPELAIRARKAELPPSWDQHSDLIRRVEIVETDVRLLRADQGKQYVTLLESGQERELRLMKQMDAHAVEIHRRLNELFKPTPKR